MEANEANDEKQPAKRSAFTIMSNVRDYCQQPDMRKFLLLVIATYCDGKGSCYPSNETLAKAIGKSSRTVKRILRELVADGEIEILTPGIGRDQKRILCLRRYAGKGDIAVSRKGDIAMTRLNGTRSPGKRPGTDIDNCHEQPSDCTALGNSTSNGAEPVPESEKRFGKDYQNQHQDQPAQSHVKWPEFAAWCQREGAKRGKGGQPTEPGFWKWLCGQKPQWRNKRAPDFDERGFLLDGKFLPAHEANAMALKDPELLTKFQRAIKRNGRIQACA